MLSGHKQLQLPRTWRGLVLVKCASDFKNLTFSGIVQTSGCPRCPCETASEQERAQVTAILVVFSGATV